MIIVLYLSFTYPFALRYLSICDPILPLSFLGFQLRLLLEVPWTRGHDPLRVLLRRQRRPLRAALRARGGCRYDLTQLPVANYSLLTSHMRSLSMAKAFFHSIDPP